MRIPPSILVLLVLALGLGPAPASALQVGAQAPEFPRGLDWLNVERPLSLEDLKGKIVVLDFWTYGCINCIHVMEELAQLEEKYGNKLAVIGVHSPKFDNEQRLDTLREILLRYRRTHPVINDPGYLMMGDYRVRAWPTLSVIAPDGNYVGRVTGEGNVETLIEVFDEMLKDYRGAIDESPLPLKPLEGLKSTGRLSAPGKLAVSDEFVAVSDSLANRVLIADHGGQVRFEIGSGEAGLSDGLLAEARLRGPMGVAFGPDGLLYVADTGNHAIRVVDLKRGRVQTLAGTGKKNEHSRQPGGSDPTSVALRSPWDLAVRGQRLYIAMAGDHRIWRLELDGGGIHPYAGSGREGIDNGVLLRATFSQPSGLALVGDRLYVADPEASAIREIDLTTERVNTLIGTGLFDFGDKDGAFDAAKLQHALGLVVGPGDRLFLADTYNHKLKVADLEHRRVRTLLGIGAPGGGDAGHLNEPGGLAMLGDAVLIADTNNGRVIIYDPRTETAKEWKIR